MAYNYIKEKEQIRTMLKDLGWVEVTTFYPKLDTPELEDAFFLMKSTGEIIVSFYANAVSICYNRRPE